MTTKCIEKREIQIVMRSGERVNAFAEVYGCVSLRWMYASTAVYDYVVADDDLLESRGFFHETCIGKTEGRRLLVALASLMASYPINGDKLAKDKWLIVHKPLIQSATNAMGWTKQKGGYVKGDYRAAKQGSKWQLTRDGALVGIYSTLEQATLYVASLYYKENKPTSTPEPEPPLCDQPLEEFKVELRANSTVWDVLWALPKDENGTLTHTVIATLANENDVVAYIAHYANTIRDCISVFYEKLAKNERTFGALMDQLKSLITRMTGLRETEQLFPMRARASLPPMYNTENQGDQALAVVKFFDPTGRWTWYATEFDGNDTFFGLVDGFECELGYFSLSELRKTCCGYGLHIERDFTFKPTTLGAIRDEINKRRHSSIPTPELGGEALEELKQDAIKFADVEGYRYAFIYELDGKIVPFAHTHPLYIKAYLPSGAKLLWTGAIDSTYDRAAKDYVRVVTWERNSD